MYNMSWQNTIWAHRHPLQTIPVYSSMLLRLLAAVLVPHAAATVGLSLAVSPCSRLLQQQLGWGRLRSAVMPWSFFCKKAVEYDVLQILVGPYHSKFKDLYQCNRSSSYLSRLSFVFFGPLTGQGVSSSNFHPHPGGGMTYIQCWCVYFTVFHLRICVS